MKLIIFITLFFCPLIFAGEINSKCPLILAPKNGDDLNFSYPQSNWPDPNSDVVREVLPINGLFEAGVGHIQIPASIVNQFVTGAPAVEWISHSPDTTIFPVLRPFDRMGILPVETIKKDMPPEILAVYEQLYWSIYLQITDAFPNIDFGPIDGGRFAIVERPGSRDKMVRSEANQMHYDFKGHRNPEKRRQTVSAIQGNANMEHFQVIIPIPFDTQPTTITVPYGGRLKGQKVQSLPFNVTAFNLAVRHGASAVKGPRAVGSLNFPDRRQLNE